MDQMTVTLLAHLSAHRRLLIHAYAVGFLREADPHAAADVIRQMFAARPTQAPAAGSGLDPAVSDMLAAMTDEAIDDFMDRVIGRMDQLQELEEAGELTKDTAGTPLLVALDR